jgi:hypothetical protein
MNYESYEEKIVHKHGVVLEGWTFEKFANPSDLSSAIAPLKQLRDALHGGACKWRRLSKQERDGRWKEYQDGIASGETHAKTRQTRSDAGRKRKKPAPKSADVIEGSDDEDESEEETQPPQKKHRRQAREPSLEPGEH